MKHKFQIWLLTAMAMLLPMTVKAQCDSGTPCTVSIYGYDSYGDGWEGSLTIYRNSTELQSFDVSDYEDSLILTVCQGDLIRIEWSGADNYQENTFTILNGPMTVVEGAHGYTYASSGTVAEFSACPSCYPVTALLASNIDTASMTLSWTDADNSGASYTITYVDADGITQTLTSTTTSIDLTGLTAGMLYTFSIVANCSATDASTAVTGSFATANGACTGATCHITLEMVDSYGDGWNGGYVGLYNGETEVETWTVSGSSNSVSVEICATSTYKLRMVERGSFPSEMGITVLDGGGMEVFSVSGMNSYQNGDLITLISNACPSCFRPDSVEFSNVVSDGADMTWMAGNDESEWLIYLNDSLVADVTSPSYSFTGLEANTGYTVGIRSLCSAGDTSAARNITFRTACEGASCEITVVSSAGYSSSSYCPMLHVWQNGDELATVCASTQQVSVCSNDSVIIIYGAPSYTWNSPAATILDGAGLPVFEGSTGSLANNSVLASFMPCPSCIPPMALTVNNVEQDEFTFSWTPRSDATLFAIYLNDSLVDPAWVDTFYTFYNLEPNTAYTASVQSICSSDDSSAIVSRNVRTACGEISLPYMVDFEDAAFNGAWYPCWDSIIHAGTDPSVNTANGNHTEGGQYSMYMQANTSENYNLVVSPQVPLPGNAIQVTFWAKRSSGWMKAGVMSNPHDTSTFIPMVEVMSGDWAEYQFSTSSLPADSTYYVAWMGYATVSYSTTFIGKFDDVTISEFTGCERPQTSEVLEVGPYTATLSWSASESASNYIVYYSTTNDFNGDDVMSVAVSNDTTVTLYGLLPQTTYYCWVATNCGAAVSDPKNFPYFTTQITCAPVENVTLENVTYVAAQISWSYNTAVGFPTEEVEMVLVDNTTGVTVDSNTYTGTSHTYTGLTSGHSYTVRMRNICQTTASVDTANVVSFSFMTSSCSEISGGTGAGNYVPFNGYYNYSYAEIIYPNTVVPFGAGDINGISFYQNNSINKTYTLDVYMGHTVESSLVSGFATVSNMTLVASGVSYDANGTGWHSITFDSAFVYNGTDNLIIAVDNNTGSYSSNIQFRSHDGANQASYIYNDNTNYDPSNPGAGTNVNSVPDISFMVNCEPPTCYAPMLSPVDVDSNAITINWWKIGQESSFVVRYKAYSANDYINEGTQTDTFFVFTNLEPATLYNVMIGSICGNDTLWSEIGIRTNCGVMQLPYMVDFESQNYEEAPACWTAIGTYNYGGIDYPAIEDNGHSGSHAVRMRSDAPMLLVSDAVPLPGDSISVSFWANPYSSTLQAGVMSDPNDASTFQPLISAVGGYYGSSYGFYEFNTATLSTDTTYYVAFRHNGSGTYYYTDIDDIQIRRDDGCRRPTALSLDSVDINYAEMSWNANGGNSTEYVVRYRQADETTWTETTSPNTNVALSGLLGANNYVVMVGAVCVGGDTLWCDQMGFATGCAAMDVPYTELFISATGELPACWVISNSAYICYDNWPASSGDGALFARANSAGEYAVLPEFNAPFNKLQITFKGKVGNVSEGDGFMMGVYNDVTNVVTWVDTITNPGQSREVYTLYTYDYTNYTGADGNRIAIGHSHNNTGGDWGFYVDSVVVVALPDCFPPQNVTSHTQYPLTTDEVYFTWTPNGPAAEWQIYIDTFTSVTPIDSVPISNLITVDTNYYQPASGMLAGGAKYRFFIRSVCNDFYSDWVMMQNGFFTNEVWMNNTGAFDTVIGCDFAVMDNGGPVAGYLHNSNSALVLMPSGVGYELQIQRAFFNTGDDNSTFTVYDGVGTSGAQLYQRSVSSAHDQYDTLTNIATSTEGALTITFTSGYNAAQGYELFVHCVDGASCYRPANVQALAVGYDNATLAWEGNADNYRVYYRPLGTTAWTMVSFTNDTVTLTGLNPSTDYELYVKGICSATDSSLASHTFYFSTICAPVTITETEPMVEDFELVLAPADCFMLVYGDDNPAVNTMTHDANAAYGGSRGFRFSSMTNTSDYNQYLITPMLSATDNMLVSFYTKTNVSTAPLRIGYSTTGNDVATDFVWNAPVNVSDSWTQLTATIPANAKFVALNYAPTSSLYYLYVDSLVISITSGAEACFAPNITSVTSVVDAITVNYSADTTVEAAITTGTVWPSTISGTMVAAGITTYTFDDLAPNTQYTIGLRTVCGADSYSPWATYTIATTEAPCDVPADVVYSDVDYTSAVITWDGGNASQWEVRVANGDETDTMNVNTASVSLDRLAPGTQYSVMVRAVCSATNVSEWSTSISFTTLACEVPTNLAASNITTTSATLNWNSTAASWELEVNNQIIAVSEKPYQLDGLTANTNYTVRVRAICTDTLISEWSAPQYFTTENAEGIDEVDEATIVIFPNPASTTVTIDMAGIEGDAIISLIDLNGRRCGDWKAENGKVVIDLSGFARGAYFVRITGENTSAIRKLVVK